MGTRVIRCGKLEVRDGMGRGKTRRGNWMHGSGGLFETLNEGYVEGIKNAIVRMVPEMESFRLGSVTYKDTRGGTVVNLGVMSRDESERSASNFSDMI